MNNDLQNLHNMLLSQHAALAEMLGDETDPDMAKAILTEMQEVLHRIDLVQNLLFQETSAQLQSAVAQIQHADGALTQALGNVKSVSDLVEATSQFLTYVDTAIDIAKKLAA